jgi:hypothetical protein
MGTIGARSASRKGSLAPLLAAAAALLCLPLTQAQGVRAGSVRIFLSATPGSVPADGKSRVRIRIEVRNRDNVLLPDGTAVFCHTEDGLLSTSDADKRQSLTVYTQGGYATVYCTSAQAGPCTVGVRVQDSSNETTLDFLAEGEAARAPARVVTVRGGWVGYAMDISLIRARDGAVAQLGELSFLAADGIEIRMDARVLRAWGVKVCRGTEELSAEDLYYDINSGRGVARRFAEDGTVERVGFSARSLKPTPNTMETPEDAFRADDRDAATWLICRSCSLFVGQKVVLRHAALYTDEQKVFNFPPYWVIGLEGYTGANNTQVMGLSTDGGLAVDFPFFLNVGDKWSTSLKLMKGTGGSSFVARDGWSFGLAQEYDSGGAKGSISANGLLRKDWGLEWRDERPLSASTQGFFDVAWPDHKSVFADANLYHYGEKYRLNLSARYDSPWEGDRALYVGADWLSEPRHLVGSSAIRLGVTAGTRRYEREDNDWVFENELYAALDFPARRLGSKTRLTPSLSNVYGWDTSGYASNALRAGLRLDRQLGNQSRAGLNYTASHRSGDVTADGWSHLLAADATISHGVRWDLSLNGSWDISDGDTYGLGALNYAVKPGWRLGIVGTHYAYAQTTFRDLEFEVARALAGREIGLRYSLDAHRISLEVGGLGLNK